MIKLIKLTIAIFLAVASIAMAAPPDANPRLGINLAGPADWMTELPFVDVFRTARPWISQKKDAGWGQGPELAIDEFGWVKRLQPVRVHVVESLPCFVSGRLSTGDNGSPMPPHSKTATVFVQAMQDILTSEGDIACAGERPKSSNLIGPFVDCDHRTTTAMPLHGHQSRLSQVSQPATRTRRRNCGSRIFGTSRR